MATNLLRSEYLKAVREYRYSISHRKALFERFNISTINEEISIHKILNYNQLLDKGVYRQIGNKKVRFTGERALNIQKYSLKNQTSARFQKSNFKRNYAQAMRDVGYDNEEIRKVMNKIDTFSKDELSVAIASGELPDIKFIYADDGMLSIDELLKLIDLSKPKITPKDKEIIKAREKIYNQLFRDIISAGV